jgi:hypothetical protein
MLLVLVILFSASIMRNIFRVCSVNRAAREAVLSAVEAIPQEGSNDNKRSDLVDNDGGKETLLLPDMF